MSTIEDKINIAELITSWTFFRDQQAWDELCASFVPGGHISISWFDGPHEEFVAASQRMAARRASLLKHQIGPPVIRVRGDKALSEVNVIIMVRASTPAGEIDTTSYARFYDRLVKENGQWKFAQRVAVYEKDRIDPVNAAALPAQLYEGLDKFPAPVKFLARSLNSAGFNISKSAVMDGTPELQALKAGNETWVRTSPDNPHIQQES